MSITLCVLLWAHEGSDDALIGYEDRVLKLAPAHGGRLLQRARTDGSYGAPLEIQFLEFPSEGALDDYMKDERRAALADDRDRAITRTEVMRVDLV
jgi:uncharacterized protein (DUF1330 family)